MKLIKIGDNFILANKQEIKLGDVVLEKNTTGYYYMPKMVMPYQVDDNSGIKVIASTSFLDENIHKLDLNNVKKIVYGFNVEKMAEELFPIRNSFSVYESGQRDGFVKGFFKSLEINEDKKYTSEDLKNAMIHASSHLSSIKGINSYIENLDKIKNEWDVEIKMRSKNLDELRDSKEGFLNNPNLYVPDVENGYIEIIKLK